MPSSYSAGFQVLQQTAELVNDRAFDLARRQAPYGARISVALQHVGRDVIAVEPPLATRVRRRHGRAGRPEDQTFQQRRILRPRPHGAFARALADNLVHAVPQRPLDDRCVFAGIRDPLMDSLAEVEQIAPHGLERGRGRGFQRPHAGEYRVRSLCVPHRVLGRAHDRVDRARSRANFLRGREIKEWTYVRAAG